MNHGPTLVDNNIIIGKRGISSNSEANILVHNLLVDCNFGYSTDTDRMSQYYKPHTTIEYAKKSVIPREEKWFNNIFVRVGPSNVQNAEGYQSDYNVFWEGAEKSSFGDDHSIIDAFETSLILKEHELGVEISFVANNSPFEIKAPLVNGDLVGVFTTTGQSIEDYLGNPITVDMDFNGKKFKNPVPGPISDLKEGRNSIRWSHTKNKK